MATGAQDRDWQGMAFFCLYWLKMRPEQVAEMLDPGDPATQKIMTVYLSERFAYARRHAVIASLLSSAGGKDGKPPPLG
ncbi:MAG: hypothetical protein VYB05_11980 [Pseudomonadota bacterium]|nr:hypothetical protein [Pseudomonadota bacterium]